MNHHLPPLRIVFFGLGAVFSHLLIALAALAERDEVPVHFVVFTIHLAGTRELAAPAPGRRH